MNPKICDLTESNLTRSGARGTVRISGPDSYHHPCPSHPPLVGPGGLGAWKIGPGGEQSAPGSKNNVWERFLMDSGLVSFDLFWLWLILAWFALFWLVACVGLLGLVLACSNLYSVAAVWWWYGDDMVTTIWWPHHDTILPSPWNETIMTWW